MTGSEAWSFVRRWWWLLVLGVVLAAVPTLLVSGRLPRVYEARARLLVTPDANALGSITLTDQFITTTLGLVRTRPVLDLAAAQSGSTGIDVAAAVDVTAVPDTPFADVVARGATPNAAVTLANAVALDAVQQAEVDQTASTSARINGLDAAVTQLASALDADTSQLRDLRSQPETDTRDQQLAHVQVQVGLAQQDYENAVGSRDAASLVGVSSTSRLTLAEPAVGARDISSSRIFVTVFLAGVLGVLAAIGVGLLIDRLAEPFPTSTQLWRATGAAVLGSVPRLTADAAQQLSVKPDSLPTEGAESVRLLRSAVLGALPEIGGATLLVTSRRPSEGTTTVAAGLASALALAGRHVILVKPDGSAATSSAVPGTSGTGLGTLLADDRLAARAALTPTSNERLFVLESGATAAEVAANLSGSRRLRQRLVELRTLADVVIVDTVEVNPHELSPLVAYVDLVLLVVDTRLTSAREMRTTVTRMRAAGASPIAAVINRASEANVAHLPAGVDYLRAQLEARAADRLSAAAVLNPRLASAELA